MTESIVAESAAGRTLRAAFIAVVAAITASAGLWTLPPLDRDEARFAQATAQMLESGDYVNIRFQDAERNKKPAGIYWMQAASVASFSNVESREIWAYRLPSAAGAVIAAVFTYLAGARLFGPGAGLLAAVLLIAAPGVAGEATIAKTDAVLLATVCASQAAFIHIFAAAEAGRRRGWVWPIIFWIALGAGILVKGPITPMIVGLTGLAMFARAPRLDWVRGFRPLAGAVILFVMIAPWAFAIGHATDGRFYTDAVGGDMLGKVGAAQERHGGPPGYHLALVWILFWPAAALLIPALVHAGATRRAWPSWFLLGWIAPAWIVFEVTATKLPHYTMPLYPALAILAARAAIIGDAGRRRLTRRIGAGVYGAVGLAVSGLVAVLPGMFGAPQKTALCFAAAGVLAAGSIIIAILFWKGRARTGAWAAAGLSILLAWTLLNGVLPSLDRLMVSPRLSAALDAADLHPLKDGAPSVAIAGYSEPSAVFLLGAGTVLTDGAGAAQRLLDHPDGAVVVEARLDADFQAVLSGAHVAARALAVVDGLNYSNGRDVRLTIYARPAQTN